MGKSRYQADLDSFLDVIGLSPKDPLDSFVGKFFFLGTSIFSLKTLRLKTVMYSRPN